MLAGRRAGSRRLVLRAHLLAVEDAGDQFAQEETFGLRHPCCIADSDADAVRIANGTRYGLSAAVFSRDLHHGTTVAGQLDAGLIRVNASTAGVDYYAPFGGERASSYGPREQGRAALQFYTRTRTILVSPPRSTCRPE